jgi:16S rRNA (uracil1498-N3)-methyltransferase
MSAPVFFAPPENRSGERISLPLTEAHHAAVVMRLTIGERVIVVDGCGMGYRGQISACSKKVVEVTINAEVRNFGECSTRVTFAGGLSVGQKFDTVVEKGTELGVKRFVPVISEKSKVKLDDPTRAASRHNRLEKVALAAMKQSRRSYRPEIATPLTLRQFLDESDRTDLNLAFLPGEKSRALESLDFAASISRASILVGPESGLSDPEIDLILSAGFIPVSLGPRILRTETAGPVAIALVMHRLGELK